MKRKAFPQGKNHDVFHGQNEGEGRLFLSVGVTIFLLNCISLRA